MKKEKTKVPGISRATIDRLPLYFRTLRLVQDEGLDIISSDELGRRLGYRDHSLYDYGPPVPDTPGHQEPRQYAEDPAAAAAAAGSAEKVCQRQGKAESENG